MTFTKFQTVSMAEVTIPTMVMSNLIVALPPLVSGKGKTRVETPRFASMYSDTPDVIWVTDTYPDSTTRELPAFAVVGWYFGGITPFSDNISKNKSLATICAGLDSVSIYNAINSTHGGAFLLAKGYISQSTIDCAIKDYVATSKAMSGTVTAMREAGITADALLHITQHRSDAEILTNGSTSPIRALPESTEISVVTETGTVTESVENITASKTKAKAAK